MQIPNFQYIICWTSVFPNLTRVFPNSDGDGAVGGQVGTVRVLRWCSLAFFVWQHLQQHDNITVQKLSPINEPGSRWWKLGNNQEGCAFDKPSQNRIVKLVGRELKARCTPLSQN